MEKERFAKLEKFFNKQKIPMKWTLVLASLMLLAVLFIGTQSSTVFADENISETNFSEEKSENTEQALPDDANSKSTIIDIDREEPLMTPSANIEVEENSASEHSEDQKTSDASEDIPGQISNVRDSETVQTADDHLKDIESEERPDEITSDREKNQKDENPENDIKEELSAGNTEGAVNDAESSVEEQPSDEQQVNDESQTIKEVDQNIYSAFMNKSNQEDPLPASSLTLDSTSASNIVEVDMYRMYNPNSGEHFYTSSLGERQNLLQAGWEYEGIGWTAPQTSDTPVFRLYNPNAGDHHYTTSTGERDYLEQVGWRYEGIGWFSDPNYAITVYRQYNPNAVSGAHNYTPSKAENDYLVSIGWNAEGISFYGIPDSVLTILDPVTWYDGVNYADVYDYNYYKSHNSDLVSANADDAAALASYVKQGINLRRVANSTFDITSYQNMYQDLRRAFGEDNRKYVMHYIQTGKKEGRVTWGVSELQNPVLDYAGVDLSPVYDYYYYRDHNNDVVVALGRLDVTLIDHFATFGMKEGRKGKDSYDAGTYQALMQKVQNAMDPLFGRAQGYSSSTGFLILVDKTNYHLSVYTGSRGNWRTVKQITVGIGKNETPTIEGTFRVGVKMRYFDDYSNGYQIRLWYATQISGNYLMHSTVYAPESGPYHLWDDRVGVKVSHGCVRMHLDDAKWIYDNVPSGTTISVFS